jgi:hypothetical protein
MTAASSEHEAKASKPSRQTEKLVHGLDRSLARVADDIVDRFGEEVAAVMRTELLEEYRRLIPGVPYLGGWRDGHSSNLTSTSRWLALHRAVLRRGGTVKDSGWLLRQMMEADMARIPRLLRHGYGRSRFTRLGKWREEATARKSQAREYPGDWVSERFDGDGQTFDFGLADALAVDTAVGLRAGLLRARHYQPEEPCGEPGRLRRCRGRQDQRRTAGQRRPAPGWREWRGSASAT